MDRALRFRRRRGSHSAPARRARRMDQRLSRHPKSRPPAWNAAHDHDDRRFGPVLRRSRSGPSPHRQDRREDELGKTCNLLADDRRAVMDPDNVSFYTVALDDGPFMNPEEELFGIAVVGPAPPGAFDFDANRAPDSFTACKYYEGFGFRVWSGAPYAGEPLWSDYYYLGYETEEIECPVAAPSSTPDLWEPTSEWAPVFRFGWIFGGCLATSNEKLKPGTPIGIVTRDGVEDGSGILDERLLAQVLAQGGTGEDCPGLSPQLRE